MAVVLRTLAYLAIIAGLADTSSGFAFTFVLTRDFCAFRTPAKSCIVFARITIRASRVGYPLIADILTSGAVHAHLAGNGAGVSVFAVVVACFAICAKPTYGASTVVLVRDRAIG